MPSTPAAASRSSAKNACRSVSTLTWWSSAVNRSGFFCLAAFRTRSNAWVTRSRFCARCVFRWPAFPSAPVLRSTHSADGRPSLFAGFTATTAGSDFSCPCIAGYGSSPSRRGPGGHLSVGSATRSPRFRRVPFARDGVFDHVRASAPRITVPHMLPSAGWTASAPVRLTISRLNSPPHTIAVYASWPPSPAVSRNTHYQAGAAPYLGRTSTGWNSPASWRTHPRR
jgi:hypothetical protein